MVILSAFSFATIAVEYDKANRDAYLSPTGKTATVKPHRVETTAIERGRFNLLLQQEQIDRDLQAVYAVPRLDPANAVGTVGQVPSNDAIDIGPRRVAAAFCARRYHGFASAQRQRVAFFRDRALAENAATILRGECDDGSRFAVETSVQ